MRSLPLFVLCVLAVSLLEFRAVELVHGRNLAAEAEVAQGVLNGHPYWKAYQNRLLGPVLVEGVSRLTRWPFADVYRWTGFFLLCAANTTVLLLFGSRGQRGTAWGYLAAAAGLFLAFQDPEWLYLWDYVDLTTMLLFAWAVVMGGWSLWGWAALFLVELANRESAQFIALWLVLDSLLPTSRSGEARRRWVDGPRLGLGVGLGLAGSLWTSFVRNTLCVRETGVVPRPEIHEFADGQFFMGRVTLDLLREPLGVTLALLLLLLGSLGFLLWQARSSLGPRAWKVAVLLAALLAANLLLAFIFELRVWFSLLPFALCLAYRWRTGPEKPLPTA